MIKETITVLYGGSSKEREVSLRSGKNVGEALTRAGYKVTYCDPSIADLNTVSIDIAFIALHGPGYEDGQLQQLLEKRNIPYTGCGVEASQIGMNKLLSKKLCKQYQIPIPAYKRGTQVMHELPKNFQFPVILKPLNEGSSIDVYIVDTQQQLYQYTTVLIDRYGDYFLEEFIDGKEVTIGVINDDEITCLPILELIPKNRFYDYEAKYTPGMTEFIIPARLTDQQVKRVHQEAKKLYIAANCRGAIRIDFRLSEQNGPYVLEFNTVPGMTETSDLPAQAKAFGWDFETLIDIILKSAIDKI